VWIITYEVERNSWFVPHFTRQTRWKSTQSFEYLEELPAVGHKTASVMSQAFGVPAFPWIRIHRINVPMESNQW
jgi:endonuclease III